MIVSRKKYIYRFFLFLVYIVLLSSVSLLCSFNSIKLYNYIINPIEIFIQLYIFSAIIDKSSVRIIFFNDNSSKDYLNKEILCTFVGKENYTSTGLTNHCANVHDKYLISLCSLPKYYITDYTLYISNKIVPLYAISESFKYNLLFCLTTLFSYKKTLRLIEFVEYYRNFGVDKFVVYNTNCSHQIKKVLMYYKKLGIMDVIYDNFTHSLFEIKRFHLWKHNDCFHRYKHITKRIIYTDHDEIIFSSQHSDSVKLFKNLNINAASYYFYPKLTITNGLGFFNKGNYSICPRKLWKYIINKLDCIIHVSIHFVIIKRECFIEKVPLSKGYVIHARNEKSYHAKACKIWKYEDEYYNEKKLIQKKVKIVLNQFHL